MNKIINILILILKLIKTFFSKETIEVNTDDENLETMKSALGTMKQTKEVILKKQEIDSIKSMSKKDRKKKSKKILEIQKIIEKNVKPKKITSQKADELIRQYESEKK